MSTRYVWEEWEANPIIEKDSGVQPVVGDLDYVSATTDYQNSISGYYWYLKKPFLIQLPLNQPYTTDTDIWFVTDNLDSAAHDGQPYAWYVKAGGTIKRVKESHGSITHIVIKGSEKWQVTGHEQGDKKTDTLSTKNSTQYPKDGYKNDYWYIYKGADTIDPISLSYTDEVRSGSTIRLTIAPSTGKKYGGTITYTIQTTTNGTDYYIAGTTTSTTYSVTVPEDAAVWNVRVYAKDNMGFTSSTYVYGNNITPWVPVISSEIVPASGDLGYLTSKDLVAIGVTHTTAQTYSISATLDGEPCFSKSDIPISDPVFITLDNETWNQLLEDTQYTLAVAINFTSSSDSRTYTFKKFTYDDTSLEGVMEGMARAIRIKREYQTEILGKNMPKEIIKVDNPVNTSGLKEATASEVQVFAGYTFFAGDSELREGEYVPYNVKTGTFTFTTYTTQSVPFQGEFILAAAYIIQGNNPPCKSGTLFPEYTSVSLSNTAGWTLSRNGNNVSVTADNSSGPNVIKYLILSRGE